MPPHGLQSPGDGDLCHAWIQAAVYAYEQGRPLILQQIRDLSTDTGRSFWTQVQTNLVTRAPADRGVWPLEELKAQWEAMRPNLIEFISIYTAEYTVFRQGSDSRETCSENANRAATAVLRWTNGMGGYAYKAVADQLISHEHWWSLLRPLLVEPDTPLRRFGTVRARSEDGSAMDRRVRCRVDSPAQAASSLAEQGQLKTAQVLEQRLELDIMRQSEEGLSEDAIEYLRLKRKQILRKLREEMEENEA